MHVKKIIMIAAVSLVDESSGVTQKVISEAKAFHELGASVDCIGYDGNNDVVLLRDIQGNGAASTQVIGHTRGGKNRRLRLWTKANEHARSNRYDIAYIRYPSLDPVVLRVLKTLKKTCGHVVMEVQSYPLVFKSHGAVRRAQFEIDRLLQKKCGTCLDRVLYMGNRTDRIFGCEAVQIANGLPDGMRDVEYSGYRLEDGCINLICVSNMYFVHGYDRLLEGLADYYDQKKPDECDVTVTMVGDGPCREEYERIAEERGIRERVAFKGYLKGDALTQEYRKATIGVGGLGLYREGLLEASSLKTKEYLLRGLPFVYAGKETGLDESFPFAMSLPNTEEKIDIRQITAFTDRIREYDPEDVVQYMRSYAEQHFTWRSIFADCCGDYLAE